MQFILRDILAHARLASSYRQCKLVSKLLVPTFPSFDFLQRRNQTGFPQNGCSFEDNYSQLLA